MFTPHLGLPSNDDFATVLALTERCKSGDEDQDYIARGRTDHRTVVYLPAWFLELQLTLSMRDINSSLILLLIYGTLYLQQSSLAPVWLFLNEI